MLTSARLRLIEESSSFPWSSWGMVVLIWISEVVCSQGLVKSCLLSGRVGIVSTAGQSLCSFFTSCVKLLLFILFLVRPSTFYFMGWSARHLYFSAWRRTFACRLCCKGCIAVVCSMNVMGVDFIAPVMMRSAWFWIVSRDCWLVFVFVYHAVELYPRTGLNPQSAIITRDLVHTFKNCHHFTANT